MLEMIYQPEELFYSEMSLVILNTVLKNKKCVLLQDNMAPREGQHFLICLKVQKKRNYAFGKLF